MIPINTIKTGDTLLVSSKSLLAKLIQKFQKIQNKEAGKWNHAAMFWWGYDELFVIEADKRGICITPFKDYSESNRELLLLVPKFEVDGVKYGSFMLPYCGHTRYDKFNLLIAQSVKILTFGKVWLGERKQKDNKFICGEWVAFVYNHFNNDMFTKSQKIAPIDLYLNDNFHHIILK